MSITKLTPPSALPVNTGDYQAQNGLTDARLVYESYPVVSGNVVKGSRFLILGSTFIGVSATAITGTPSDYVVLTVTGSNAAPSYLPDLTGVTWSDIYNGYYDGSNNLVVFDEMKAFRLGSIAKPRSFYNKIISDITDQVLLKASDAVFNSLDTGQGANLLGQSNRITDDMVFNSVDTGYGASKVVPEDVYFDEDGISAGLNLPSILVGQTGHQAYFVTSGSGLNVRLPATGTYSYSSIADGTTGIFTRSKATAAGNTIANTLNNGEQILIHYRRIS